jgi:hypothetical protein
MSLVKFKLGINQEDTAFVSIKSSTFVNDT